MRLLFELRPVEHLEASVEYYRDLGLVPLSWPDDDTVLLGPDRRGAPTIMLVRDSTEAALRPGGVYDVGDLDAFFARHPELDWLITPTDHAAGRYAVFADRTGASVRLLSPDAWVEGAAPRLAAVS